MTTDFEHVIDLLPASGIPLASLRILQYIGEDGNAKFRFSWEGEGASTDIIGVLEVIKSELILKTLELGGLND